jgi:3-hydroxyisobutyrate dehydrogenase
MKIGIAGTGKMGAAMTQRLAGLGHSLTVWNRTPDKAKALESLGAKVAPSPAALAADSEIVISILSDAAAVDKVYDAFAAGDLKGKLFIEMSTVRPEVHRKMAEKVKARGGAYVDCPVSGTVGPAKEGKLFGFAGGADGDIARAKLVLDQLCRRLEHVGPVGAGASVKLAINLPLLVYWQALSEALALCKPLELDPSRLMDIFGDTSGTPQMLKVRGPVIAGALGGKENTNITVDIDTLRKDLREMVAETRALGRSAPAAEGALAAFDEASRAGHGARDCSSIPQVWLSQAK